ncbi:MAG: 1-deoxy-D-xylulose-5-phosphate reductoisomerase, partial [Methylophilaceae bacterium]|nr:1-deoxy-D-xylulose-5-phosphate reductoisomerase [Methylophilaceae bacterium]
MKQLTILGATGSIGASTLEVVSLHPERFKVFALTAWRDVAAMQRLCLQYQPRYAVMRDAAAALLLKTHLADSRTEVLSGEESLSQVARDSEVDIVVAAIVGASGLRPTIAAATAGKHILLANKEVL